MIAFLLGLIAGIGLCELITQRMHYSSIVMDAVDWIKSKVQ